MALGKRLLHARKQRGLDQTPLASRVNELLPKGHKQLTQQSLYALEDRDSNKTEFAYYLAVVLDISLAWLMAGVGEMEATAQTALSEALPGVNSENLMKLSPGDRKYIAGRIDGEVDRLLSQMHQGLPLGKAQPGQEGSLPTLAAQ